MVGALVCALVGEAIVHTIFLKHLIATLPKQPCNNLDILTQHTVAYLLGQIVIICQGQPHALNQVRAVENL